MVTKASDVTLEWRSGRQHDDLSRAGRGLGALRSEGVFSLGRTISS